MDLSAAAKKNRDRVEEPLFQVEKLLDDLEECQRRVDAAMTVWQETAHTLQPASQKLDEIQKKLSALQDRLAGLWQEGFENKWK
jgi:exonuclease VII small subunit